jgi:hypothetical protein
MTSKDLLGMNADDDAEKIPLLTVLIEVFDVGILAL